MERIKECFKNGWFDLMTPSMSGCQAKKKRRVVFLHLQFRKCLQDLIKLKDT